MDLDTPYHEDHVRDNVLNAGCMRCRRFFTAPDIEWKRHRRRLLKEVRS